MRTSLFLFVALLLSEANAAARDTNFWIYLCFGQSNMESGGQMNDADRNVSERFRVMADFDSTNRGWVKGKWYHAVPPLAAKGRGICMVDYFGRTMVANLPENIRVGVVKVAVPGCKIELFEKDTYTNYAATVQPWMKNMIKAYDGNPYQFLVDQANAAQKDGVIKGILLHQGESNPGDKEWPNKVKGIYDNLMKDLNLNPEEVPLLAGELVNADQEGRCAGFNKIMAELPKTLPKSHVISSAGCTSNDRLHFNSEGSREFGKRYAEKLLSTPGYKSADVSRVTGVNDEKKPAPVLTEYGLVQGVAEKDLTVYRGIPFAAPPVGDLRWRPPQPAKKWDGVRDTSKFASDPYQGNGSNNVSEDCLYLNIWTPAKSAAERIPVLVWIYGGGFAGGSTSTPTHNGEHLARKGVVLVSINYRVGPLGFLAHPELSAESPRKVSGNYGLLDQIAGLKWVQKNISKFGGDPARVTIFGESAGGIAVSMLCASPEATGLFRGAMSQSGGSFGPTRATTYPGENMKTLAQAEREGEAFAKSAGVVSIAELRRIAPRDLPRGRGWPIVDGWVIPDDQYKLYEAGKFNDVDILVGYNSDEGLSFSRERTPAEFIANVEKRYGPFAAKLLKVYPVAEDRVPKSARDLMRDAAFGWQTWAWARLQARNGKSKVFYYYFDQHPKRAEGSPQADHGMPHGVDVPYVFQTLNREKPGITPGDLAISETVSTYWVNFAKRGDPNGADVPVWPKFTEKSGKVMYFKDEAKPGPGPSADALTVLDSYFAWRRTPEGEAWAKQADSRTTLETKSQ